MSKSRKFAGFFDKFKNYCAEKAQEKLSLDEEDINNMKNGLKGLFTNMKEAAFKVGEEKLEKIVNGEDKIPTKRDIFNGVKKIVVNEIQNEKNSKKILEAQMVAVFINKEGKPVVMDEEFKDMFF